MSTQTANDSAEMTFGEHLDELRKILIRVALVFALLFIVLFTMKGVVLKEDVLTFPDTPEKWRMMSTTTGTFINAGHYRVLISGDDLDGLAFDALDIQ